MKCIGLLTVIQRHREQFLHDALKHDPSMEQSLFFDLKED